MKTCTSKYIKSDVGKYCKKCYEAIKNAKNGEFVAICDKCQNIPTIVEEIHA